MWQESSCYVQWAYLVAKPSRFPPSPTVIYTGADWSFIGVQMPFTTLYAMLETRSWYIATHQSYTDSKEIMEP